MATIEERLEQIENALLVLGGGLAGREIGKGTLQQTLRRGFSANPVVAGGLTLIQLQRMGLLDPFVEELLERGLRNPTIGVGEELGGVRSEVRKEAQKQKRKVQTKFNKAVSKGMQVVRASTSYGKKGTISNAKRAFTAVTKTVSKVNRGLKLPRSGITRKIALAA